MTFEEFLAAWNRAVAESRLPRAGFSATSLDLGNLDREVKTRVEPLGGQYAEPFYVTAALSFRWSALQTARGATIEEDVLVEILGRDGAEDCDTDHPWVRVDVTFSATVPYGKPLPMPPPERWAAWAEEVTTRLTEFDPRRCGRRGRHRRGLVRDRSLAGIPQSDVCLCRGRRPAARKHRDRGVAGDSRSTPLGRSRPRAGRRPRRAARSDALACTEGSTRLGGGARSAKAPEQTDRRAVTDARSSIGELSETHGDRRT